MRSWSDLGNVLTTFLMMDNFKVQHRLGHDQIHIEPQGY